MTVNTGEFRQRATPAEPPSAEQPTTAQKSTRSSETGMLRQLRGAERVRHSRTTQIIPPATRTATTVGICNNGSEISAGPDSVLRACRWGSASPRREVRAQVFASPNVRNRFRQQCRAALRRSGEEKPAVSRISPDSHHDSGGRDIQNTETSRRDLRPDDRGGI